MVLEDTVKVGGLTDEAFAGVRTAFKQSFKRTDACRELGAAIAVYHRGRCVVNLYGGTVSVGGPDWTPDTLINVWSVSKGVTACALAKLVDEGAIGYKDLVKSVWPDYAAHGKGATTIAHLLSHQAGLPGFAEPTTKEDLFDWDLCAGRLARQSPAWEPGTATSYHALTYGWLAGEIVRRVSGLSVGAFLQKHITGPLKADVYIGLPERFDHRCATLYGPRSAPPPVEFPPVALMALQNPIQEAEEPNDRRWRAAEIPAANGQASALGLARLYGALSTGGSLDGVRILTSLGVDGLTNRATTSGRKDMLMGFEDCWGMGMMLNPQNVYGPGARAYGYSGWGGSFACADPDLELSIGYVCNQMGSELTIDPRSVALSRAVTACATELQ